MDVYVARQPIFNRKMNIIGYELLYRRSMNNFYEGVDDNQSTAELINNAFYSMQLSKLTNETKAFINFPEKLIEEEIPLLLPSENIVVEILEHVNITENVIRACKSLKKKGYIIALDDFIFDERYLPLIEIVDIIKIEFTRVEYSKQKEIINKYGDKIKFLAEKVETREQHKLALNMGYSYFQGYFYSKPIILKGKEIVELNISAIKIINELNLEDPKYNVIADIIEKDLGLSYKLLKHANTIKFGSRYKISSIKQALVRMGMKEIEKWSYLVMLKGIQNIDNKELIQASLIRARFMELFSNKIGKKKRELDFYMTGAFSSIDILLNRNMKDVLTELPMAKDVKKALLRNENDLKNVLDIIINFEKANWENVKNNVYFNRVNTTEFMKIYLEAINWVANLDY